MTRFALIVGLIAGLLTVGAFLHSLNSSLAEAIISRFGNTPIVYYSAWLVELCFVALVWLAFISFRLSTVSRDARRMGIWMESRKTVLDIKSASGSVNTMVIRYGIRRTEVHHLRIWTGPGPAQAKRHPPLVEVINLPADHTYEYDYEDKGDRRYYNVWFSPPLRAGRHSLFVELSITEDTENQYYMFQDQIPRDTKNEFLQAGYDYFSQRMLMPVRLAVLEVVFPPVFIPTGRSYFQIRVAETQTPVPYEQRRLQNAVQLHRNEQDRRVLTATIKYPLTGATYFLLWRPPERPQGIGNTSAAADDSRAD